MADLDQHVEHRGMILVGLAEPSPHSAAARLGERILVIEHRGLEVPARRDLIPVRIEFHEAPNYSTYGLLDRDYPRVFADPGAVSKHRLPGDALCLWFPNDPEERRWRHTDGVLSLLNVVRNHLFFEEHWRATGGHGTNGVGEGVWLGDEAAHGFPDEMTAA